MYTSSALNIHLALVDEGFINQGLHIGSAALVPIPWLALFNEGSQFPAGLSQ